MLARCKETTTSTGNGDLTLAGAVTGYETLNSRFSNDSTDAGIPFQYFIQGSTGAEWESGFGYLSDATTLKRNVCLRSSAGVASKVSFAAGTKYVSCAMNGHGMVPTLPTVYASATSRLIASGVQPIARDSGAITASLVYYFPFRYDCADTVDAVWCMTSAVVAGDLIAGVYTLQPSSGLPFHRITSSLPVTVSGSGAHVAAFNAITLPPGWYYLALNVDSTVAGSTFRIADSSQGASSPPVHSILGRGATNPIVGFTQSHTYNGATLPKKAESLTAVSVCPILGLRVA